VTLCIVAKRCVLEQKLLTAQEVVLPVYEKSIGIKMNDLDFVDLDTTSRSYQGHVNHCVTFDVDISETVRDRGLVPMTTANMKWDMGYLMVT